MAINIKSESFSRGFDHGNYANAYQTTDWEEFAKDMGAEYEGVTESSACG